MQLFLISLMLLGMSMGLPSPSGLREVKLERGNCPMFWYSFNGRCYKYVASHMSWADAELHCVSQEANLVSIHSTEENVFVMTLIENFDHTKQITWIGLSDLHKEGAWMWSDGSPVSFVQWHNGQPDNHDGSEHCAETQWEGQPRWNDLLCSELCPSVCATRKPVCE